VPSKDWTTKAGASLRRYRVMALITGVMLLVLCVELILKYVVQVGDDVMRWIAWVPFAHGWIYVLYLVTVMDLWSTMRWRFRRLVSMVLAGVVPVTSFVVERSVHRQGLEQIGTGRPAPRRRSPHPADVSASSRS
jgi:integral membrane protein